MDDETRNQFKELREYVDERTRDMETTLLTEFRKWALRIEATMKPTPPRIYSLEERVALVEQRLDDMERPKQ